jgi:hypothetical protein
VPKVNVVLKAVEARRFQDPQGQVRLRIDHNSHISLVQADGDDKLRVDFAFTTSYGAFGVVKSEGSVHVQDPSAGAAATQWEKDRNLPQDMAQMVHSAILQNCVPDAVGLAKLVRLPPPIPLPQVQVGANANASAQAAETSPTDSPEIG